MTRAMDEVTLTDEELELAFCAGPQEQPDQVQDVDPAALDAEADPSQEQEDPGSYSLSNPQGEYVPMPQQNVINVAPAIVRVTDGGKIQISGVTLSYKEGVPADWRQSTTMLFLACCMYALQLRGNKRQTISPFIRVKLREYMELRGLKQRKDAKKQLVNDCERVMRAQVFEARLQYPGLRGDMQVGLYDVAHYDEDTDSLFFRLSQTVYEATRNQYYYLSKSVFRLNTQYNPHALNLAIKLHVHASMNNAAKDAGGRYTLSVESLRNSCHLLPREDELDQRAAQYGKLIRAPFERDLAILRSRGIEWQYREPIPNGHLLTDKQAAKLPYREWARLLVTYTISTPQPAIDTPAE